MIREIVAIGSWGVVAAYSLLPEPIRSLRAKADVVLTAAVFFGSAAATRFWLQETRTREQILAFVAAAIALPLLRRAIVGQSVSTGSMIAGAGGAILGALIVKFSLEGLSF